MGGGPASEAEFVFGEFSFDDAGNDTALPLTPQPTLAERLGQYTPLALLDMLDTAAGKSRAASGTAVIRDLERQINYDGRAWYEVPADPARYDMETSEELRRLVQNYLVLLGGGLSRVANDAFEPTVIRSTVVLRDDTGRNINAVIEKINAFAAANLPPAVKVTAAGAAVVQNTLNDNIVSSQIISLAGAILMVFIIVAASNKSLVAGVIGSIPLALAIFMNFAIMGFSGIKLALGTAMIASIAVGVGVDYTIHFMEAFKREFQKTNGSGNFLLNAFTSSGKAILVNAVSVGGGFLVLVFSNLNFLREMGILIALNMGLSALFSLTLVPALLLAIKPKFIYGRSF